MKIELNWGGDVKNANTWKSNNTILSNQEITKQMKEVMKKKKKERKIPEHA